MRKFVLGLAALALTGACSLPPEPGAAREDGGPLCEGCTDGPVDALTQDLNAPDAPIDRPVDALDVTDATDDGVTDAPTDRATVSEEVLDAPADVSVTVDARSDATCASADLTLCAGAGCVNAQSSVEHCGECGRRCPSAPFATATCAAGACSFTCETARADCNRAAADGCEVELSGSVSHCGACGTVCPTRPHASPTCAAGACGIVCAAGFADCDGNPLDGCEVDLQGSAAACGACGRACTGAQVCTGGRCACPAGLTACGTACVDVASDRANCGECGRACASGEFCATGRCQDRCDAPQATCGGACIDPQTSLANCGGCGVACAPTANTTATCEAGRCVRPCLPGFGDCNGNAADGCETDLRTSIAHCRSCGAACQGASHATAMCSATGCVVVCDPGRGDCNGSSADGCEVDLSTSAANCGTCGGACPARPNASPTCAASVCGIVCNAGFADCNGNALDGCEVDLQGSAASCGACGRACAGAQVCTGGRCACPAGLTACGAACVDVASDRANCGACGRACAAGEFCSAGLCRIVCTPLTMCGSACVDLNTSATSCGACGRVCPTGANASPSCAMGSCGLTCVTGYGNCDGATFTGCEVNLRTSTSHCGACGSACPARANASPICSAGACGYVCNPGYADCNGAAADGCEVDVARSVSNCGACGTVCPPRANASPTCAASACGYVCNAGSGDCDGFTSNGCETSLTTSESHCGACGRTCPAGQACTAGACVALSPPRPIAPLATTTVLSARPLFKWELATGTTGVSLQICRDRGCATVVTEFVVTGTSGRSPVSLSVGRYFWRMRGRQSPVTGVAYSAVWSFRIESPGVTSGTGQGTAGTTLDVNGDGYADLVVGAYAANSGGLTNAGAAYVYYGSAAGLPSTPQRTLTGTTTGNNFGRSVASAGDVNGDGYGDLIVGATTTELSGRPGAGAAHVYYGSAAGLPSTPQRTLTSAATGDYFGWSVAGAGDVNGDGYADVVVGAYQADPGSRSNAGAAYVYYGSAAGLSSMPQRTLEGATASDYFGRSVAGAGDVNGDGYADVLVGADGADPSGRSDAGVAYVYLGGAAGLSATTHRAFEGAAMDDNFGYSVAGAGDINGDGYADVLVGAYTADPNSRTDAGAVYVALGSSTGLATTPQRTLTGFAGGDYLGHSVAGAGDVNGDGYADVVVGAHDTAPSGRTSAGAAYVHLGGPSGLSSTPQRTFTGALMDDRLGWSAAGAGDVNGDGYADIVVGATGVDFSGRMGAGAAYVHLGGGSGVSASPHRTFEGAAASDSFGWSVASAGHTRRPARRRATT